MALINCIECGKEISDKASACPHCGAPVVPLEVLEVAPQRELSIAEERNRIYRLPENERKIAEVELGKRMIAENKSGPIIIGIVSLFTVIILYSCSGDNSTTTEVAPATTEDHWAVESAAKDAVKSILKDPESAEFYELKYFDTANAVCGYVNAKNSFGGLTGKTRFQVFYTDDFRAFLDDGSSEFNNGWNKVCIGM